MTNTIDLRNMSLEDLKIKLLEEQGNYQKMLMSHKISSIEKPISIQSKRRDIARLKTVITEKTNS